MSISCNLKTLILWGVAGEDRIYRDISWCIYSCLFDFPISTWYILSIEAEQIERAEQRLSDAKAWTSPTISWYMEVSINGGTPIAGWFINGTSMKILLQWMMKMIVWGTPMDWKAPEINFTCCCIDHQSWVYQQWGFLGLVDTELGNYGEFTRKPWIGIGKRYQIYGLSPRAYGNWTDKKWGICTGIYSLSSHDLTVEHGSIADRTGLMIPNKRLCNAKIILTSLELINTQIP